MYDEGGVDSFGLWLQTYLEENGITQTEIGLETGIGEPQICRYIKGRIHPRIDTVERILKALNKHFVIVDD